MKHIAIALICGLLMAGCAVTNPYTFQDVEKVTQAAKLAPGDMFCLIDSRHAKPFQGEYSYTIVAQDTVRTVFGHRAVTHYTRSDGYEFKLNGELFVALIKPDRR